MVQGILADMNVVGHVEYLTRLMQTEPWAEFWKHFGLALRRFEDVGLAAESSDKEIWLRCQIEQLILVTNNRNDDSADSLEATIRNYNTSASLPVFTIANLGRIASDRVYSERVVERFYEYLLTIDNVRGTGRLFLP